MVKGMGTRGIVNAVRLRLVVSLVTAFLVGAPGLVRANEAPSVTADSDPVTVNESDTANNRGVYRDPEDDPVIISASAGTVQIVHGNNPGQFIDNGQSLGSSKSWGVALGDVNGDGHLDAFVTNDDQANKVWLNNGLGVFTDSSQDLGSSRSFDVALGDVDGDGDLDAFVGNDGTNRVWLNQGGTQGGTAGQFLDSGQGLGISDSAGVALGDVDGDGDLDAFVGNDDANRVWLNQGGTQGGTAGQFLDSGQDLGIANSMAVALGDVDGDGDLDAFVANSGTSSKVWLNNGAGVFSYSGQSLGSYSACGVALADVDGDSDLDAFVANYGRANKVWLNGGTGVFADSGQSLGSSTSFDVALGDVDGDGDLDAFVANRSEANRVWLQSDSPGDLWFWSFDTTDGPDESQTVTITATDSHGASSQTTFELVVNNVAPSVAADSTTVTVNEAELATNRGTFSDPGDDVVEITASAGTIERIGTQSGTWSWVYVTIDGPAESQTVTITATDSDGASDQTTFELVVNNVAPSVAADSTTVTVNEAELATNRGTFSDPSDDVVEITASAGTIERIGTQSGTWNWAYASTDGPAESQTVTITATDSDGASGQITFELVVNNVAPSVAADSTTVTVNEAESAINRGTFSDPSDDVVEITASAGSIERIGTQSGTWSWVYVTIDGPAESQTVTITATDSDGASGQTTFELVVNNVAPSVAADHATVTAIEGEWTTNRGTFSDPGDDLAEITASVGAVTQVDAQSGTWSWVHVTTDGPAQPPTVTITATDRDGATGQTTFELVVANVAPSVSADQATVTADEGQTAENTITCSDPGLDDATLTSSIGAVTMQIIAYGGTSQFIDSGQSLESHDSRAVALGDVDGDGDVDAFVGNVWDAYNEYYQPNKVWLNQGGTQGSTPGEFLDSGQALGSSYSADVALGDVDGDGDLDAFVGNAYNQVNKVWLNDGAGSFTDSLQSLGGSRSYAVALGDMDGDGDLDAFVGNYNQPNRVWLNDGWGGFADSGQSLGSFITYGVALGDVDGDGDLDAFVANHDYQANKVWLNDGVGGFADSGQDLGTSWSRAAALGDVDGDGDLDAFVTNSGANKVWRNDGTGIFSDSGQNLGAAYTVEVVLGDVDGDGDLDAFVANSGGNKVWRNDGLGGFDDSGQHLGWSRSYAVALGDVDGDGDPDAFVGNAHNQPNRVWINRVTPTVSQWDWSFDASDGPAESQTVTLTATDSDGASSQTTFELVVNNVAPSVAADNATVTVNEGQLATNRGTFSDPADNIVEITASAGTIEQVGAQNGTWTWSYASTNGPTETQTITVIATDSDGASGQTTFALVVNNVAPSVAADNATVIVNVGELATNTGTFSDPGDDVVQITASVGEVTVDPPSGTWSWSHTSTDGPARILMTVVATDSDGAGRKTTFELVVDNTAPSVAADNATVTVDEGQRAANTGAYSDPEGDPVTCGASAGYVQRQYRGTPGEFLDSGQRLGSSASQSVALGDLDGDGDLDAFVANAYDDTYVAQPNWVWINQGGAQGGTPGEFADSGQRLGGGVSWAVALGDVDGDGDLDAFLANSHVNRIWLNDGSGTFTDSGQSPGYGRSYDAALGDLDGDGDLDAYVANRSYDQVWLNQGWAQGGTEGVYARQQTVPYSYFSTAVALGDVDADGDLDAFVATFDNDLWFDVFLNLGDGTLVDGYDVQPQDDREISWDVALGDLDGDGDLDAFASISAGSAAVCLNDGNGVLTDSEQDLFGWTRNYGVALGDVDGDGDLDAFEAGSTIGTDVLWLNQGGAQGGTPGEFLDSGQTLSSSQGTEVALGDLDGDGDLDAFVTTDAQPNEVWLNQTDPIEGWIWTFDTTDGPAESQTVTITATDSYGAVGTTTFGLVVSNVAPLFEAGSNETLPPQQGEFSRTGIELTDPGADVWDGTVNFGDLTGDQDLDIDQVGKEFDLAHTYTVGGTFTVTVTVNDDDGGSHTDTFQVEVQLNEPPVADAGPDQPDVEQDLLQGGTVTLDGSGSTDDGRMQPLTYTWTWDGGTATGVSPTVVLPLGGPTTVTLTVFDGQYSDSDTVDITVVDTTPPVLTAPADMAIECDESTDPQNTGVATAVDICDVAPVVGYEDEVAAGDCPQESVTTRTWTATDASGNSTSAVQTITVEDTMAPVLAGVLGDATVECDSVPAPAQPTATDNCDDVVDIVLVEERIDGECANSYTLVRTWTATDNCGNFTTATQTVTIQDTTPPVLTVPEDIVVKQETPAGTVVEFVVTAADICDAAPAVVCDPPSGSTFPVGTTTVTCTATDASGNVATASFTVRVLGPQDLKREAIALLETIDCGPDRCVGIQSLTLYYSGGAGAPVRVSKCNVSDNGDGTYTVTPRRGERLPGSVKVYVGRRRQAYIRTSCSRPLDPGDVYGPFTVDAVAKLFEPGPADREIQRMIDHILRSLNIDPDDPSQPWKHDDLWGDETHLDPQHGHMVFNEEQAAVRKGMSLSRPHRRHGDDDDDHHGGHSCACCVDELRGVIDDLARADRLLAETALDEARNTPGANPREIARAQQELLRAEQELQRQAPDKAIDHYKKAWEHALKALKGKPGHGHDDDDDDDDDDGGGCGNGGGHGNGGGKKGKK